MEIDPSLDLTDVDFDIFNYQTREQIFCNKTINWDSHFKTPLAEHNSSFYSTPYKDISAEFSLNLSPVFKKTQQYFRHHSTPISSCPQFAILNKEQHTIPQLENCQDIYALGFCINENINKKDKKIIKKDFEFLFLSGCSNSLYQRKNDFSQSNITHSLMSNITDYLLINNICISPQLSIILDLKFIFKWFSRLSDIFQGYKYPDYVNIEAIVYEGSFCYKTSPKCIEMQLGNFRTIATGDKIIYDNASNPKRLLPITSSTTAFKRCKLLKLPSNRTSTPLSPELIWNGREVNKCTGLKPSSDDSSGVFSFSRTFQCGPVFGDVIESPFRPIDSGRDNTEHESHDFVDIPKSQKSTESIRRHNFDLAGYDLSSLFSSPFSCNDPFPTVPFPEDELFTSFGSSKDLFGDTLLSEYPDMPRGCFSPQTISEGCSDGNKIFEIKSDTATIYPSEGTGIEPDTSNTTKGVINPVTNIDHILPTFTGFRTAAGCAIKVTPSAITVAKEFMLDANGYTSHPDTISNGVTSSTIRPTDNEPFTLDQDELGSLVPSNARSPFLPPQTRNPLPKPPKDVRKRLRFSPDRLEGSRYTYHSPTILPTTFHDRLDVKFSGGGFKTASGISVSISEDSLKRARDLFAHGSSPTAIKSLHIDSNGNDGDANDPLQEPSAKSFDPGDFVNHERSLLKSSAGKVNTMSEQSLTRARLFLKDECGTNWPGNYGSLTPRPEHGPATFCSNYADPYGEQDPLLEGSDFKEPPLPTSRSGTVVMACGFKSAAGSDITVDRGSLIKARELMEEVEGVGGPVTPASPTFKSEFRKRTVVTDGSSHPSSDRLENATNFGPLGGIADSLDFGIQNKSSGGIGRHNTFQSAFGDEVCVSSEALHESRVRMISSLPVSRSHSDFIPEGHRCHRIHSPYDIDPCVVPGSLLQPHPNRSDQEQSHPLTAPEKIIPSFTRPGGTALTSTSTERRPKLDVSVAASAIGRNVARAKSFPNASKTPNAGEEACTIKVPGHLYALKSSSGDHVKRIPLRRVEKLERYLSKRTLGKGNNTPGTNDLSRHSVSSNDAEDYIFDLRHQHYLKFIPRQQTRDVTQKFWVTKDCAKIPMPKGTVDGNDWYLGKDDIYDIFIQTPGVVESLIPKPAKSWLYNHYRMIVWKLASMEFRFPLTLGTRLLTPHNTISQLKYRYDLEIDNCQRSCIKKITERDDTPSKTMILLISRILGATNGIDDGGEKQNNDSYKGGGSRAEECVSNSTLRLELSDGWYPIMCHIDRPLRNFVETGKMGVGDKLCISQAKLVGSAEANTPLEAYESVALSIQANSTRRAKWDTRLGYLIKHPRPILVSISSLFPDGGSAPCLNLVILKAYPLLYMQKYENGSITFLTERAYESGLGSDVFHETCANEQRKGINGFGDRFDFCDENRDPNVNPYKNVQKHGICKITPVLKVRVTDFSGIKDDVVQHSYQLTIYNPNEEMISNRSDALFYPGNVVSAFNLNVTESMSSFPNQCNTHKPSIQLKTCSKTVFEKLISPDRMPSKPNKYNSLAIRGIVNPCVYDPVEFNINRGSRPSTIDQYYKDIDVVGIVIHISLIYNEYRYKTYPITEWEALDKIKSSNKDVLASYVYVLSKNYQITSLKFSRQKLKDLGLADILKTGEFVACSNLAFSYNSSIAYNEEFSISGLSVQPYVTFANATSLSHFSKCPKPKHLSSEFVKLTTWMKINFPDPNFYLSAGKEILSKYLNSHNNSSFEGRNFDLKPIIPSNFNQSRDNRQAPVKDYSSVKSCSIKQNFRPLETSTPMGLSKKNNMGSNMNQPSFNLDNSTLYKSTLNRSSSFKYKDTVNQDFSKFSSVVPQFGKIRRVSTRHAQLVNKEFKPPRRLAK